MSRGTNQQYTDIFVAVHGIGDQSRNETARAVATRFARMKHLAGNNMALVAPQPLGYFHTDVRDYIKVSPADHDFKHDCDLSRIGFSEVYWADLPQVAVDDRHTMDETKAWARTVVARVRAAFFKSKGSDKSHPPDFTLVAEVLEDIIDTINILENLTFLAKKAGIFEFNLRSVLEQYVGDVQVFTEFESFRHRIIGRFQTALAEIHSKYPDAQLHIVSHSEGTVVTLFGLLLAMAGERWEYRRSDGALVQQNTSQLPHWLNRVKSLMTIGSPIDKHLLLWSELFDGFGCSRADNVTREQPVVWDLQQAQDTLQKDAINWHNYYDLGDPVGFKLDSVRAWFTGMGFEVFAFDDQRDHGFARYLLPGKAHTDYWQDAELFEHFQRCAMERNSAQSPGPQSRWLVGVISPTLPYVLSFLLLFAGSAMLHRSVHLFKHPEPDTVQLYYLEQIQDALLGVASFQIQSPRGAAILLQESLGIALLIAGTTLLARWPRLVRHWHRWLAGFGSFALGAAGYWRFVPAEARQEIGGLVFGFKLLKGWLPPGVADTICTWKNCLGPCETVFVIGMALVVSLIGLFGARATAESMDDGQDHKGDRWRVATSRRLRLALASNIKRRARWFGQRMRPLVISGVILVVAIVAFQLYEPVTVLTNDDIVQIDKSAHTLGADKRHHVLLKWLATPPTASGTSKISRTQEIFTSKPPLVPVLLSGAAFLYLWWLAALIFDLSFVWHRYVRHSKINDALREWRWPKHNE